MTKRSHLHMHFTSAETCFSTSPPADTTRTASDELATACVGLSKCGTKATDAAGRAKESRRYCRYGAGTVAELRFNPRLGEASVRRIAMSAMMIALDGLGHIRA
jgi:hypothetical protein